MAGTGGDDDGIREGEASVRREEVSICGFTGNGENCKHACWSFYHGHPRIDRGTLQGSPPGYWPNPNGKKFWIDEKLSKNCFMMLARSSSITWGDTEEYWTWSHYQEDCFGGPVDVEEATLVAVCWLEIKGSLPSIKLSPMPNYEVVFKFKMNKDAYGWTDPVEITLNLPNGTSRRRLEDFAELPKEKWCEIHVGDFETAPDMIGSIRFSLFLSSTWKRGLVVRGAILRPKY